MLDNTAHSARLRFSKMHGIGNDFVVFDAVSQRLDLSADQLRCIADRRYGVGCDQILLVEPAPNPRVDFGYRIFNADGSEVGQCGNGARCFARFVRAQGLSDKDVLRVATATSELELTLLPDGLVAVNFPEPEFAPARIPLLRELAADYEFACEGQRIRLAALSLGNPHAVIEVAEVDTAPVVAWGASLSTHPDFPAGANIGFMQIVDSGHIRLRVFERGSGETLACGSGACAAMAAGRQAGRLLDKVKVSLPGGELHISWPGPGSAICMSGPAEWVFDGELRL